MFTLDIVFKYNFGILVLKYSLDFISFYFSIIDISNKFGYYFLWLLFFRHFQDIWEVPSFSARKGDLDITLPFYLG